MVKLPCRLRLARFVLGFVVLPAALLLGALSPAGEPQAWAGEGGSCCCLTYEGLGQLSTCQLERLFACAPAGGPMVGFLRGRLLIMTDFPFPRSTVLVSSLAWRGKHVAPDGTFINQFACRRRYASRAVYGPSYYDGKPAIIMEYPRDTPLFGNIRDEFREVAPGLYLGRIYSRCPCPRFLGFMTMQVVCDKPAPICSQG